MERFRAFIGRLVDHTRLVESLPEAWPGFEARYLPERFEEFDEIDFALPYEGERRLVVTAALEQGRIQRILLGWIAPGDPEDAMRSLPDADLARALEMRGDELVRFFETVTL